MEWQARLVGCSEMIGAMEDLGTQLVCLHKRFYCPIAALARLLQDATQEHWNNWLCTSVNARTRAGLIAGRNQTLLKRD